MYPLARTRLISRLVESILRGRVCFVLGGPGSDRLEVARAAAAQVAEEDDENPLRVSVIELDEDPARCLEQLTAEIEGPVIRCGGLALHRILADGKLPDALGEAPIQRFPLVPLVRRDLEFWARELGVRMSREEIERATRATGGHPGVFHAWLVARRSQPDLDALEGELLEELRPLFSRIDAELSHPELAACYAWLEENGPADVAKLRRATGAEKPALDRLVLTGVVSRTLGESARIAISCGLYQTYRTRSSQASGAPA